jgi:Na+/proline symporter
MNMPAGGFLGADYAVVGYRVIVAGIGSSFYRRKSTPREYFLGGRSIPWLAAGISIISADLSAITVMGVPAWTFRHNLELAWMCLSYPLVAPLCCVALT